MADKQDSNVTGTSIIEELTLGVLPAEAAQHWELLDPNSFTDFGNDVTKETRKTLNPKRKVRKGGVVDVAGKGGHVHDFVPHGLLRSMRGFFFTDGDEGGTNAPLNYALTRTVVATAIDDTFTLDDTMTGTVVADSLVYADGFAEAANNGLHLVLSATSTTVVVDTALVNETAPAAARIRAVGHRYSTGALVASVSGDYLTLVNADDNFDDANINAGDTIFIGGDSAQFATLGLGYARVVSVTSSILILKDFTGTPAADGGAGVAIDIYCFSTGFRDPSVATEIVRRYYQLERTLGADDDGNQAEYIVGCIANELMVAMPSAGKITATLNYLGLDRETIPGTGTLKSAAAAATLHTPESEEFMNTSTHTYVARVIKQSGQANLVGYLEKVDMTINNGASHNKAVGVVGGFDFSVGDFVVTGSVNAYFNNTAVMDSIRNNDDVSLQIIGARNNEGFAFAMPLVTLSGGKATVASDQPIMMTLDLMAAASNELSDETTLSYGIFAYLPTVAMPS